MTVRAGLGLAAAARTGALHTIVIEIVKTGGSFAALIATKSLICLPHLDLAGAELAQLLQLVGGVAQLGVGVGQLQMPEVRYYCRYHGYCRYYGLLIDTHR